MKNTKRFLNRGFTLIELAVVLVIIGLIVGGILIGRDLIHVAELRKKGAEIQSINLAVSTFRVKYNALPGDMRNPATFFSNYTSCGAGANGNGDGIINGADATESVLLPCHLGLAGLVTAQTSGSNPGWLAPMMAYLPSNINSGSCVAGTMRVCPGYYFLNSSQNVFVTTWVYNNFGGTLPYYILAIGAPGALSDTFTGAFSPADAYALDVKLDDGLPKTGTTIASYPRDCSNLGASCATPCMADDLWGSAGAWVASANTYLNMSVGGVQSCTLIFKPSF